MSTPAAPVLHVCVSCQQPRPIWDYNRGGQRRILESGRPAECRECSDAHRDHTARHGV